MAANDSSSLAHGTKRAAEDELKSEQRLSKRLDNLRIDDHAIRPSIQLAQAVLSPHSVSSTTVSPTTGKAPAQPAESQEGMAVDDTPHRIYINDLDAEIARIDAEEEEESLAALREVPSQRKPGYINSAKAKSISANDAASTEFGRAEANSDADDEGMGRGMVFLKDIERRLARIPHNVLTGRLGREAEGQQLILYRPPPNFFAPAPASASADVRAESTSTANDNTGEQGNQAEEMDIE